MKINFFVSVLLFGLMGIVSAQQYYGDSSGFFYGTEQVINSLVENLEPLLRALLGGQDWTGYLLFEKTLLFIIISIIIGLVLENLPVFKNRTNKGILRLIAVIIGILAVRGINFVWINTILVQYQVLFITVAGILPFMIYWLFLQDFSSGVKKVAWSLYGIIYLGLWITNELEAYESVYLWGAVIAFIYGLFIDESIQTYLKRQKANAARVRDLWLSIAKNDEKIRDFEDKLRDTSKDNPTYEAINEQIKTLRQRNIDLAKQAS